MPQLLVPGYSISPGSVADQTLLVQFMRRTYQELCGGDRFAHLAQTIEQYFSDQTPVWWVDEHPRTRPRQSVACLWLGSALDQIQGDRYTHLFLLYVAPEHRRRGIGSALMRQAETWAKSRGERQVGLQVFQSNQPALAFYQALGYQPQAISMVKPLT